MLRHFCYPPQSDGDNVLGIVRPFVCLFVFVKGGLYWSKGFCLCVCNQGSYADNLADAVDFSLVEHLHEEDAESSKKHIHVLNVVVMFYKYGWIHDLQGCNISWNFVSFQIDSAFVLQIQFPTGPKNKTK